MNILIVSSLFVVLLFTSPGIAQQSGTQELQLNLEQFPDTNNQSIDADKDQELQLNLEQFNNDNQALDKEADQRANDNGELKLNLEQFDEQEKTATEELELNLEQFNDSENTDSKPSSSDDTRELDLDKFDDSDSSTTNIGSSGSKATEVGESSSPRYNYRHIFLIGGMVLLVFLYFLSRRRKSRR